MLQSNIQCTGALDPDIENSCAINYRVTINEVFKLSPIFVAKGRCFTHLLFDIPNLLQDLWWCRYLHR